MVRDQSLFVSKYMFRLLIAVAPRKLFLVPFQRDGNFTGRDSIMSELGRRYDAAAFERFLSIALVGDKDTG